MMNVLLLLFVSHARIGWTQTVSTQNISRICNADNSTCSTTIRCTGIDACKSEIVQCPPGEPCVIICDGKAACGDANLVGDGATDVTIVCAENDACKPARMSCGTGKCLLDCDPTHGICENLLVDTNGALSFECLNACPVGPLSKVYTVPPTNAPTFSPVFPPTANPTNTPTTHAPTIANFDPTSTPTLLPTIEPTTANPSPNPTIEPTDSPSVSPTYVPSMTPSYAPSFAPSFAPSSSPSFAPSASPTSAPSAHPTLTPSFNPTFAPTLLPTQSPTQTPTINPTMNPTKTPSIGPTRVPSSKPSLSPTTAPTSPPTVLPTVSPLQQPSVSPTLVPSFDPTASPILGPSVSPTLEPTLEPTVEPITGSPTTWLPTSFVNAPTTETPTLSPTGTPSTEPTLEPTTQPASLPTDTTATATTALPTLSPSHALILDCSTPRTTNTKLVSRYLSDTAPPKQQSIASYGVEMHVHIDYAFDAPESQLLLETLQEITLALVSTTVANENCSASTPFTWQLTGETSTALTSPRTRINASVVVCTLYQQQQLLSVLSTNHVLCVLLNCIAENMRVVIPIDAAQFDSMGIMFYGVASDLISASNTTGSNLNATTTKLPVAVWTSNATDPDDIDYFGRHGSRLRIGLMLIIGTLAVVAALLGCAVMCIHACRRRRRRRRKRQDKQKHMSKHHALTSDPQQAHAQSTVLEMGVTGHGLPMVVDASMVESVSRSGNQAVLRQQFDEYDEDDERMPIGIDGLDDDDEEYDEDSLKDSPLEGTKKGHATKDDKGVFVPVLDEEPESDSSSTSSQTQTHTGNESDAGNDTSAPKGNGQIPHANLQSVQTAQSESTRCPCSCHLHSSNCNMESPMLGANSISDTNNTNTNTNTNCGVSQCGLTGCNGHGMIPATTVETLSPNPPNVLRPYEHLNGNNMYMHPPLPLDVPHHDHNQPMINRNTGHGSGNAALWECLSNEENALSDASKTRPFALV